LIFQAVLRPYFSISDIQKYHCNTLINNLGKSDCIQPFGKTTSASNMPEKRSLMQQKFRAARGHKIQQPTPKIFSPTLYFFYGTLMDIERLKVIAGIDEEPQVENATAERQYLKYWGHYPVICNGDFGQEVEGIVWTVPTADVMQRLRDYETDHYREKPVRVTLEDGKSVLAMTFSWASFESELSTEPVS
jgi:gamma-glutamylcyclotransferase (GGCT)/AIG2-like uncharacterized protein YtfP